MGRTSITVVMGAGNILMRDEGIGVHVIRVLRQERLPPDVEIVDGGTAALDAIQILGDVARLVIVDAVKWGGEPGTIYRFSPEDISEKREDRLSLHQLTLLDALEMAEMIGAAPREVFIVGVEPKLISAGLDLSPELERRIPKIVETVKAFVRSESPPCDKEGPES